MSISKMALILLIASGSVISAFAQELIVKLPTQISTDKIGHEFSSLATWRDGNKEYVVLIPTLKGDVYDKSKCIYAIPSEDVKNSLSTHKEVSATSICVDSKSYNNIIGKIPGYGGIEGTIIVGNNIYFSVECSTDLCYVVKGAILKDKFGTLSIKLEDTCSIEKPSGAGSNDGFEGITYLPKEKKLFVAFEDEYDHKTTKAFKINLSLNSKKLYHNFPSIDKRLPDFTADKNDRLICLSTKENNRPNLIMVANDLASSPIETNLDVSLNWEGIILFDDGVLMISDNCNCPNGRIYETKLGFFSFKPTKK